MFVEEDGPFDVFAIVRSFAGVEYDEYSNKVASNTLAKGLSCVGCISVWVSFLLFFVYLLDATLFTVIALPFAASAVAIIINKRL
jgi:hypothetical protein